MEGNVILAVLFFFFQFPTPTVPPTIEGLHNDVGNIQATADAILVDAPSYNIDDGEFSYENENLMPDVDRNTRGKFFGYLKWLVTDGNEALMGPFAPVIVHLFVLFSVLLFSFTIQIAAQILITLYAVLQWLARWIVRIIELIPFVQ